MQLLHLAMLCTRYTYMAISLDWLAWPAWPVNEPDMPAMLDRQKQALSLTPVLSPISWPDTCTPIQRGQHIFWVLLIMTKTVCSRTTFALSLSLSRSLVRPLSFAPSRSCSPSLTRCLFVCVCKVNVVSFVLVCSHPHPPASHPFRSHCMYRVYT